MALKQRNHAQGQIVQFESVSARLKDNPLGDPWVRTTPVYLPATYNNPRNKTQNKKRQFSVLYDFVGFTGAGPSHTNWKNFEETVPEKLDRLIADGTMPPSIVVFPDCFTKLGGNQYVNSSALGPYADYLTKELVGQIDGEFRTRAERAHRACFGKSSGGYGAIVHGMKYPETWGAVGNHSGDAYFDFVYKAEWPAVLTALQRFAPKKLQAGKQSRQPNMNRQGFDDGRVAEFLQYFDAVCEGTDSPSGMDITILMMICMAATYDPDKKAPLGFRLPYDLHTGELIEARWNKWLTHDPIHMVAQYKANLKTLRGIYIDCGWRDQYHIHFGARQLSRTLSRHNIAHRYEEFDGTHSGIDHRMDVSLPFLAKAIR